MSLPTAESLERWGDNQRDSFLNEAEIDGKNFTFMRTEMRLRLVYGNPELRFTQKLYRNYALGNKQILLWGEITCSRVIFFS